MKSSRAIIMLVFSLLAGVVAVLLAARWMGQQVSSSHTQVLVASRDLELGQAITPAMLQDIAWPAATRPDGSFSEAKKLEGRVVRSSIFKGEPILVPKLAPEGTKAGLDSVIKEGRRAITVKVNEVVGVAGFLAPGSYVDLLINMRDERENPLSQIVLERIMVLAVAQESNRGDDTKPKVVNAVTLEVTPLEAEKIDLARNIGTLSLMLRNQVDTKDNVTVGARRSDLFTRDGKATGLTPVVLMPASAKIAEPVRRAAPKTNLYPITTADQGSVEVIRGVHKSSMDF